MRGPSPDRLGCALRVPQRVPALRRRPHHLYWPRRALRLHTQADIAVLPRQIYARRAADPGLMRPAPLKILSGPGEDCYCGPADNGNVISDRSLPSPGLRLSEIAGEGGLTQRLK